MDDWQNTKDYNQEDCRAAKIFNGFDRSEFVESLCSDVVENYGECDAGRSTACSHEGERTVVVNGEALIVACQQREISSIRSQYSAFIFSSKFR